MEQTTPCEMTDERGYVHMINLGCGASGIHQGGASVALDFCRVTFEMAVGSYVRVH